MTTITIPKALLEQSIKFLESGLAANHDTPLLVSLRAALAAQPAAGQYTDIISDGGMDPRNAAQPERKPMTDELVRKVVRSTQPNLSEDSKAWKDNFAECMYWLNAFHGIKP